MTDRSRVADPDEVPAVPAAESPAARHPRYRLRWTAIVLGVVVVGVAVPLAVELWHGYIDLQVYRNGARTWLDGGDLYGPMPKTEANGLPFTYPPLAALFFAPLAVLPLHSAEMLVLAVSIGCLSVTGWLILARLRPGMNADARFAAAVGSGVLLSSLEPVRETYSFGQINLLLMTVVALDVLVRRPPWPRGMLIGIAVAIKLTPAVFLLYFLVRRDWRTAVTMVASTAGATALGFVLFPHDSSSYWFHALSDTDRIGPPAFAGNQSLKGFLFRLGLGTSTATTIWLLLSLVVVALAAWWMKQLFETAASQPGTLGAERALVVALFVNAAAGLLISPVSWSHHWVWAAPALVVAGDLVQRGGTGPYRRSIPVVTVAIAAMFLVGPHWLLPHHVGDEAYWSLWEQLLGGSYVLVTFAGLVVGAIAYRPAGVRKAASAAA